MLQVLHSIRLMLQLVDLPFHCIYQFLLISACFFALNLLGLVLGLGLGQLQVMCVQVLHAKFGAIKHTIAICVQLAKLVGDLTIGLK